MVDTFRPLLVSREALAIEDAAYPLSWLETPSRELPDGRDEK
jgi:hypothetical protein